MITTVQTAVQEWKEWNMKKVDEDMSKVHDDYNKERGKIATYDEIMDLIYDRDKEQTECN